MRRATPNGVVTIQALSTSDPATKPGCSIKVLADPPLNGAVSLGAIHLSGQVRREADVLKLVDQKACDMKANAIFVREIRQQTTGVRIDYEIRAAAYLIGGGEKPAIHFEQAPVDAHKEY